MEQKRSGFSGKLGFVLAAAGSAVGLGNIWRFPYLAAMYGGGVFLLVYIILAVTFGFALMVGEIALGRKTQLSAVSAFSTLNKKYSFLGYLAAIVPMIILPYYSVIGGWVTKYLVAFCSGNIAQAAQDGYFSHFIAEPGESTLFFAVFIGLTALIVLFGVEKGIEKVSKFMMPVLVVLSVGIAIYAVCLPGAMEGVKYYIMPDFKNFSFTTVIAAMGQLFYSMSLAMGIMITYGSYMKKDVNIESATRQISLFDTGIAFFAGLMIVPAVFAFSGGDKSALGQGPGLMFVTLPKVFNSMPGGGIIGAVFFVLVLLAALAVFVCIILWDQRQTHQNPFRPNQLKKLLKILQHHRIVFSGVAAVNIGVGVFAIDDKHINTFCRGTHILPGNIQRCFCAKVPLLPADFPKFLQKSGIKQGFSPTKGHTAAGCHKVQFIQSDLVVKHLRCHPGYFCI